VLRQEFNFVNGKPEGPQSNWDERGQLIARGTVTQGVREGTFVIDVLQAEQTATKTMVVDFRATSRSPNS